MSLHSLHVSQLPPLFRTFAALVAKTSVEVMHHYLRLLLRPLVRYAGEDSKSADAAVTSAAETAREVISFIQNRVEHRIFIAAMGEVEESARQRRKRRKETEVRVSRSIATFFGVLNPFLTGSQRCSGSGSRCKTKVEKGRDEEEEETERYGTTQSEKDDLWLREQVHGRGWKGCAEEEEDQSEAVFMISCYTQSNGTNWIDYCIYLLEELYLDAIEFT